MTKATWSHVLALAVARALTAAYSEIRSTLETGELEARLADLKRSGAVP